MIKRLKYIVGLLLLFVLHTNAQTFPVTAVPQVNAPAPIYFTSYADASIINGPLRLQLTLNDLTVSNREVRIRAFFEGNGIAFQSNDIVIGAPALFLDGGVPLNLGVTELSPYFAFENITGISPAAYGQIIPEGSYQFCFEVYDVLSGARLSRRSCATTYIFQNEPPLLVSPFNQSNITEQNPINLFFQWTPRHINVSNVQYELSIAEIWDNTVDPQAAFLSSPPVFQVTTTNTSYLYGAANPLLLSNKRYAWRVQAKALNGAEEVGLFKNNGFSEIFWFDYSAPCLPPENVDHEVKGTHQANILWVDFTNEVPEFNIRYREKSNDVQNQWFYSKTTANFITLWDLRPGTVYEYQVAKKCSLTNSEYSAIQTFTTFIQDDEAGLYNCGIAPDISISNRNPLENLNTGETFKAGDFPIKVIEVSGSSGRFSGKGYVSIPYLGSIKVAVEFTNILLNTDRQLAEGTVITTYDPDLSGIIDPWDELDDIGDIINGGDNIVLDDVDFDIERIEITDDGNTLVVIGKDENGNDTQIEFPYDDTDTYQVTGSNGVFVVDEEGNLKKIGEVADGGSVTGDNTDGVNPGGNGTVDNPSAGTFANNDIAVTYVKSEDTKYGWDEVNNPYEEQNYPKVKLESGGEIYPFHKAVPTGKSDSFYADIDIKNPEISIDSLVFKTVAGMALKTERVDGENRFKIIVEGHTGYKNEEALITYKNGTGKQVVISSFFIHHLKSFEDVRMVLVPINNAFIEEDAVSLAANTFASSGAALQISKAQQYDLAITDWDKNGNNELDYDGSGLLSQLPEEFAAIKNNFKNNYSAYSNRTYYIFVFDNNIRPTKSIAGFMPRGNQFGFVFSGNGSGLESKAKQATVIAHEIGHGVFKLQHPFETTAQSGSTNWLMDYNNGNGTEISKVQWEAMGDEGIQLYFFDKDEEGEYDGDEYASKVFQTVRCSYAGGNSAIVPVKFEWASRRVNTKTEDFGNLDIIISEEITNLGRVQITTSFKPSDSYYGVGGRTFYILDYGGLVIRKSKSSIVSDPNDQSIRDQLNKLQDYLFSYTQEEIQADYEQVLRQIEGKESFNDEDIKALKDIANCAASKFSTRNRYIIIKKIAFKYSGLKERYEDLIFDLIENHGKDETVFANDFLDEFVNDPDGSRFLEKLFKKSDNSGIMTLWLGNEQNFDRFLDIFYKLWSNSKYANPDLFDYTEEGDGDLSTPLTLMYSEGKWFPVASYSGAAFSGNTITITKSVSRPIYTPYGNQYQTERTRLQYELFQPILIYLEGQTNDVFTGMYPALYFAGDVQRDNLKKNLQKAELAFDVITTVSGIGNLFKLRHLRHVSKLVKLRKTTIAGITFTSDVANIILKYTELCEVVSDKEFCDAFESYNSYLQNALFATGVVQTAMGLSRLRAARQYEKNRSKLIARYGTDDPRIRELDDHFIKNVLDYTDVPDALKQDIQSSAELADLFKNLDELTKLQLVNAWSILEGNPILRKRPQNLRTLREAMLKGVDRDKLAEAIGKSRSKQKLMDEIADAESYYHILVIIKDYDNIPGVARGRYSSNSSSISDKSILPNGWDSAYDLPTDKVKTFSGTIDAIELTAGQKIYRVHPPNGAGGPYWTLQKPRTLEEVIGGTAVRPEWNNFEYLSEYNVPQGVTIRAWKGKAAKQAVSDVPSNYHLPGGDAQLFIGYINRQDPNFNPKTSQTSW
ncbi:fibronectin type III domain-containing protein [Ascidiimonas sp. W6]|uniref:fibronectin type III domain-containing protein n=1 Tax=Ascidiimonas meishanensis TaxID=3128903 RepID=UPI0030EEC9EF